MQIPPVCTNNSGEPQWHRNQLLPVMFAAEGLPVICHNCAYVNEAGNHFCTHCGYPLLANSQHMALYRFHRQKRSEMLYECAQTISQARGILYIMSALSFIAGILVWHPQREALVRAGAFFVISGIYFGLGRWTLSRPFTALLIALLMMMSFIAINTWAEARRLLTTTAGLSLLVMQVIVFYFILRGVKAAYQADLLEEEE